MIPLSLIVRKIHSRNTRQGQTCIIIYFSVSHTRARVAILKRDIGAERSCSVFYFQGYIVYIFVRLLSERIHGRKSAEIRRTRRERSLKELPFFPLFFFCFYSKSVLPQTDVHTSTMLYVAIFRYYTTRPARARSLAIPRSHTRNEFDALLPSTLMTLSFLSPAAARDPHLARSRAAYSCLIGRLSARDRAYTHVRITVRRAQRYTVIAVVNRGQGAIIATIGRSLARSLAFTRGKLYYYAR